MWTLALFMVFVAFILDSKALFYMACGLLIAGVIGCSSVEKHEYYNADERQDGACYAKYGGLRGYCDAIYVEQNFQIYPVTK